MKEEKRDPYKHKERWLKWKAEIQANGGISEISKVNSEIILKYLFDMELGLNRGKGSPRKPRMPSRLNDLRGKMVFFAQNFKERYGIDDLTKVDEEVLFRFIGEMENGIIKKKDGNNFNDIKTFARDFKAFWNWYMKTNRKKDIIIKDIVEDLNARPKDEAQFVFLKVDELKKLLNSIKFEYRVLICFILDSCMRPPTETNNANNADLSEDLKEIHIRDEIVKAGSFGRTNKLMICPKLLKEYIKQKKLGKNDFLFNTVSSCANKYLQRKSEELFGNGMTRGGKPYNKLTLYDFRHIACCYWSKILDKDRDIMRRFGWKQSNKIYYYSKFLEDDEAGNFILDESLDTEKKLNKTEEENKMLKEKLSYFE